MKLKQIFSIGLALTALSPFSASANGFNYTPFHPTTDSASYLSVWSPKTLDAREWELGTSFHYEYHPFQLYQAGARVRGVLDHVFTQHVTGSLGLIEKWLEVGVDLPVVWAYSFSDPNTLAPVRDGRTNLGDMQLYAKTHLYQTPERVFSVGVLSNLSLPTGSSDHYLGDNNVTFTETLLLEMAPIDRLNVGLNVGFQVRPNFTFRNIEKTNQFKLGLGAQYNLCPQFQVLAEFDTQTRLSSPFSDRVNAPSEILIGSKYLLDDTGWMLNSGVGLGVIQGAGVGLPRVFVGLSYSPSFKNRRFGDQKLETVVIPVEPPAKILPIKKGPHPVRHHKKKRRR